VKRFFELIDKHSADIVAHPDNVRMRFARAMDFYLVQDLENSAKDLTECIVMDDQFFPAYFMRALVNWKRLDYKKAEQRAEMPSDPGLMRRERDMKQNEYNGIITDLDKVLSIAPDFAYAYYNRGTMLMELNNNKQALEDFNHAIELNPSFAEAYYNRGLVHIFLGETKQGVADLSKAGELGIVSSYNVIKRYAEKE